MDVYKASAFEDRVNYAASVISAGKVFTNGRHFDTCFEMNDGDFVAAALIRRTVKNPNTKLAQNIFRFLGRDRAMQSYEETKSLTRRELREQAIRIATKNCEQIGYTNI